MTAELGGDWAFSRDKTPITYPTLVVSTKYIHREVTLKRLSRLCFYLYMYLEATIKEEVMAFRGSRDTWEELRVVRSTDWILIPTTLCSLHGGTVCFENWEMFPGSRSWATVWMATDLPGVPTIVHKKACHSDLWQPSCHRILLEQDLALRSKWPQEQIDGLIPH